MSQKAKKTQEMSLKTLLLTVINYNNYTVFNYDLIQSR